MPPTSYTIDSKWGESLVGLRMAVLLSWWPGYSGTDICLGKITKFDKTKSPQFLLEVNNMPGDTYAIQYNAVLAYAQVEHPTFTNFRLPDMAPKEPAHDDTIVIQRRGCGRCRGCKRRHRG